MVIRNDGTIGRRKDKMKKRYKINRRSIKTYRKGHIKFNIEGQTNKHTEANEGREDKQRQRKEKKQSHLQMKCIEKLKTQMIIKTTRIKIIVVTITPVTAKPVNDDRRRQHKPSREGKQGAGQTKDGKSGGSEGDEKPGRRDRQSKCLREETRVVSADRLSTKTDRHCGLRGSEVLLRVCRPFDLGFAGGIFFFSLSFFLFFF